MKVFSVFVLLCLCVAVICRDIPYKNCGTSNDHIKISKLNVIPFPPQIGANVTVIVSGTSDETINGGTVLITLSFDGINLVNSTVDLCSILSGVNVKCPIPSGPNAFTIVQLLPSGIPTGDYTAIIQADDLNNQELLCIQINFTLSSKSKMILT